VEGQKPRIFSVIPALMTVPLSFSVTLLGPTLLKVAVGASILVIGLAATALVTARRRAWKIPRVVTTREGITATDVHGQVRSAPWSGVGTPSLLRRKVGRDQVVKLEWTDPAGERISLDLGDTMDLVKVRRAITAHAPSTLDLRSDAKFAYDEEDADD